MSKGVLFSIKQIVRSQLPFLHRSLQSAYACRFSSCSLSTALELDQEQASASLEHAAAGVEQETQLELVQPTSSLDATLEEGTLSSFGTGQPRNPLFNWFKLPAVPRARGIALVVEQKELTAVRWVTRCCPELSHILIEKLFRLRQVRMRLPVCQADESETPRFKRVPRKEIVTEGSILYLPRSVLRVKEDIGEGSKIEGSKNGIVEGKGKVKSNASNGQDYEPTPNEIEWIRNLVLHMDTHVMAINKPPGLAVQGGVGVRRNLDALLGPALSFRNKESPKLVHRLDKETSGMMVLGRTQEGTALLHSLFRAKTASAISGCEDNVLRDRVIKRKYWALVIGTPSERKGRITAPLKKVVLDGGKSEAIVVADDSTSEGSQEAITDYRVLGPSVHGCTWLELHPLTGRKHQIRVHCAQALGMPIVGDYKYGRQVHDNWPCRGDDNSQLKDDLRGREDGGSKKSKNSNQYSQRIVKGSVSSEKPFLHLHSRLLTLPKISEVAKKKVPVQDRHDKEKKAFLDRLRLVAPLPTHMKASWNLLPPSLKGGERKG